MLTLANISGLIFHLYMIFLVAYSSMAIFSLLRFGQSRITGLLATGVYLALMSSLYFQSLLLIGKLE